MPIKVGDLGLEGLLMAIRLVIRAVASIAGAVGIGYGIHGGIKMYDANNTMKTANSRHKKNLNDLERQNKITFADMDRLGEMELDILNNFQKFADVLEMIHNRPQFKPYNKSGVNIPKYDGQQLKKVSIGAGVLLGGIGGAALGTAGGFAAAGATTAAAAALGTASTGTAITSLSGVAATKATLAVLGGGSIAAGGGGMAVGATILGATTWGVGLLVGGIIFSLSGTSLSDKADKAWGEMEHAEEKIKDICRHLKDLSKIATMYENTLSAVRNVYEIHFGKLQAVVQNKTDWNSFSPREKTLTENTVLLVGLLHDMCKIQLVTKSEKETGCNAINSKAINKSVADAKRFIQQGDFDQ